MENFKDIRWKQRFENYERAYETFARYVNLEAPTELERAVVFGSRAMGNYKPGSDLDLALFGEELDFRQISGILNVMEESVFPHALDIVIYDRLENPKLKEHIVLLYSIGGVARGKDDLCEHGKRTV